MKEIVVLSGKGGTGKTTIVASFAALAESKVLADCDVDAADLHLLLHPDIDQSNEFWSGQCAVIDYEKCAECGLCQELCRFDAIKDFTVDRFSCEGCGFCSHICPEDAIAMQDKQAGYWYTSETEYGPMVHARLGIAEEHSGKLVAVVRQDARRIAEENGYEYIITDGPPGTGCPVISSLSGANLALVITEPTLSGIHDLKRVLGVCQHFEVPSLVCINKYDLNIDNTKKIEDYCNQKSLRVISKIPFDGSVIRSIVQGVPVVEYTYNTVTDEITKLWSYIENWN
jgi:MinD superfamily P-loop ATPase